MMSELTRFQAEKVVWWLKNYHGIDLSEALGDIQKALDENQTLPALKPFVWYEATPENCARIPKDNDGVGSVWVNVWVDNDIWGRSRYDDDKFEEWKNNGVTHFMLIEAPK